MPLPNKKPDELYTYADYLSWDEDERMEIIGGKPVMQATPSRKHQQISFEICRQLGNYLEGKNCKAYAAPFAVRLFEEEGDTPESITEVFEPDIAVICDKNKLDDKGCKGAPDMIVEILSPSTARYDQFIKLGKYQRAGVKEYWIVDPLNQTVQALLSENKIFHTVDVYTQPQIVKVNILDGCYIDLSKVFAE